MSAGRYKSLLKNTGLMFLGSFGSKIISFIMLPFYTMWLSVEDYGTSDIITVYSTIVLSIVSLSIGEALFVIPSQKTKNQQTCYFSSSLLFSAFCVAILFLLYLIVTFCFSTLSGAFTNNITYICLITATTLYTTTFQQFCKAINKISIFATAGILQTLFVAIMGFILIPKYHLDGYVWSVLISNVVVIIFIFFGGKLYQYLRFSSISFEKLKEMFSYSIPLIPNSIIWLVVSYLNRPLMEVSLGMYALGIYSLANRFSSLINTIYLNFSNSWQISILEQYRKDGFEDFYNSVILLSYCIMSLFIVGLALLTKPLVILFLNANYYDAITYIPILCLSSLFLSLGSMVGAIFSATKKSKYFFYSSIWSAISAIVLNFLLIKSYGIYGACWSCVVSYLIGGVSRILFAKQFTIFTYSKELVLLSILSTASVCVMSYFDNYLFGGILFVVLALYIVILLKRMQQFSLLLKHLKRR